MSVQQLGSLYERLLEQQPELEPDGKVRIRPNPYARKDSGSFYTPQDLVDLIVDQTLKPLIEERLDAFEARPANSGATAAPGPNAAPSWPASIPPRPSSISRCSTLPWAAATSSSPPSTSSPTTSPT